MASDGNDEFISEECRHECCNHEKGCYCCGSAQKDDADGGEDNVKASFEKASNAIV